MGDSITLSQLCEAIVDCEHKTAPTQPWGIPLIRTTNIKNGRIDFEGANKVSENTYRQWTSRLEPNPGDLILAREAPVGEVGIIPPNHKASLGQRTVLIRPNKKKVYSRYLLYLLLTPAMRYEMQCRAEGSVVPHLNMSEIRSLIVPKLPPLSEQKAIAHILGTLDDKIELNQRMNRTLEDIARAIFKSWFIDFDPVRAKMEGRQPEGMSKEVADLFPDSFVDSELGMIPKGWEVRQLSEVVSYLRRGIQPKYTTDKDGVLVLNQRCVRDFRIDFANARRHDSNKKSINGREVQVGDVLINSTGVGTLGRVAQVLNLEETTVVDSHVTIVRTNSDKLTWNTLGLYIYSRQLEIEALGEGSTGQTELSKDRLGLLNILIPPLLVQKYFDEQVLNVRRKTLLKDYESLTLSHIRDSLLPKLISGEIRVKEAEKIVEKEV